MKRALTLLGASLCLAVPSHAVTITVLVDEPHEFSGAWASGAAPYEGHARADGIRAPFIALAHGESVGPGRGAIILFAHSGPWGNGAFFHVDGNSQGMDVPDISRKWTYLFDGAYEPLDGSWAGSFSVRLNTSTVPDSGAPFALTILALVPMARRSRFRRQH